MATIGLATVVGNAAALVALKKARRAPSHYPLASLAIADLLLGVFVVPIAAARELFVFHLHWSICACWSTLDVLCCTASILSLCALGWERWSGITAPLSRARRDKRAKLYAALVWPVSTVVALPTAFVPSPVHYFPGEQQPKACTVNTNVGYVFFSTFMSFYLPACLMVTFYVRILSALSSPPDIRAHRGRVPCVATVQGEITPNKNKENATPKSPFKEHSIIKKVTLILSPKGRHLNIPGASRTGKIPSPMNTSASPRTNLSRQRRATHSIVMLMFMFLVCWTPFFVMILIDSLCECVWDAAWQWCTWLGYANSALNPIVYGAASPSVRRALQSFSSSFSTKTTNISMTPVTSRRASGTRDSA